MNRLRALLSIRAGEGRLVALVALLFATVEAARGLGDIAGNALFVDRYGADALPPMYVVLGLVSLVVALAYGAAVGTLPQRRFLPGLLAGFAGVVLVERVAMLSGLAVVLPVVWISVQTVNTILLTLVWSVAGVVLTARQAKRLFPLATSAAIAGALVGTLLAGPLARLIATENLLVAAAAALVAAAALTGALLGRFGRSPRRTRRSLTPSAELRAGFEYTRRSPLMRLLAVSYLLFAVLYAAVQLPYLRALHGAYPDDVDLATTLGLVSAGVTVAAFVVSLGFANRVFARFGVAAAALLLPLVYLGGFGLWLVVFSVPTAIAVRFAQETTQRGISNPAWSALFNVVPLERRPQVLAFADGVPGQVGTILAGLLLIVAGAILAPGQVFIVGFVAALVCTWLVLGIRRRYGDELLASLRAGLAEQVLEGGPGLLALGHDPQVLAELRRAIGSPMPGTRRLAAELLGRLGDRSSSAALVAAIADEEADVRTAALGAVERIGRASGIEASDGAGGPAAARGTLPGTAMDGITAALRDPAWQVRVAAVRAGTALDGHVPGPGGWLAQAASILADDPSPRVRAEVAVALAAGADPSGGHAIVHRLLEDAAVEMRIAGLHAMVRMRAVDAEPSARQALADPEPEVRAAGIAALAAIADDGLAAPALPALVAALEDDAAAVRRAASSALAGRAEALPAVLGVLETGSARGQDAALAVLSQAGGPGDAQAVETVRRWALRQLDQATALRLRAIATRRATAADDGSEPGSSLAFLASVLGQRERQVEDRLLTAISVLGAPGATGAIRRSLQSRDADVRGQALEALDALGDHQLAGSLVQLLEADEDPRPSNLALTLESLCDDPDPWVRALALRANAARIRRDWELLVRRAATAVDPVTSLVLGTLVADGGPTMPRTERTLGEIDRMLFLRRVPLFGQLAPEDLQRVAMTATEQLYPNGEALVHEGDLGDELIVIVEGRVRVVHGEGADAQLIRTYSAGDHIGELAVLTDRPRAATVIADDGDVRGLVIDGAALRSILRERPDAAMAMLATLADRLGRQR